MDDVLVMNQSGWSGRGDIAQALLANHMNVNALRPALDAKSPQLRANGLLTSDEWKYIDRQVMAAGTPEFNVTADLMSRDLTYDPGTGMGAMMLQSHKRGTMDDATLTMDPEAGVVRDRQAFGRDLLPLPIASAEFKLNIREIEAHRRFGQALDMEHAEDAARAVSSKVESVAIDGADVDFGGGTIQGLTNLTGRNTKTITDWTSSAATPVEDVLDMVEAAENDNHNGPFALYYGPSLRSPVGDDYKANSDKTLRDRLLEIEGIDMVKVSSKLGAKEVVLMELQTRTARLVNPVEIQTVQWELKGGLAIVFKVLAIMVPQFRIDQEGQCGIVHGSTA